MNVCVCVCVCVWEGVRSIESTLCFCSQTQNCSITSKLSSSLFFLQVFYDYKLNEKTEILTLVAGSVEKFNWPRMRTCQGCSRTAADSFL